ncbi:MAG: hypothetical protein COT74_04700 [Bdellovibrionales bacterium CG10_big_fil_rev_8_21_14_0_10_45_34]|nr:MAG: hypothetical protein COT74_04700 [Bdellovibrionales bacterium CG10_big_fil_rev_8_21_14_0_10_45_34]
MDKEFLEFRQHIRSADFRFLDFKDYFAKSERTLHYWLTQWIEKGWLTKTGSRRPSCYQFNVGEKQVRA